jgi:hypothetical protein
MTRVHLETTFVDTIQSNEYDLLVLQGSVAIATATNTTGKACLLGWIGVEGRV